MRTFQLRSPDLLEPFWFQRVIRSLPQNLMVQEDGAIVLEGSRMPFVGDGPAPGALVRVWLGHTFYACLLEDYEARQRESKEQAANEAQARRELLNSNRREAERLNGSLRIPVPWQPGFKDVLSGLSERSMGTGRNKRTVNHVLLGGPIDEPGFKRRADDFLCTSSSGSNGKNWSGSKEALAVDGEGQYYPAEVTCKQCLRLAQRWKA